MEGDIMGNLNGLQQEYESKVKRVILAENGISLDDLERYERYLIGDNEDELREQARLLVEDIGGQSDDKGAKSKVWRL